MPRSRVALAVSACLVLLSPLPLCAHARGDQGMAAAPADPAIDTRDAWRLGSGIDWTVRLEPILWGAAPRGELALDGGNRFDLENINLDEPELAPGGEATIRADRWVFTLQGFAFSSDGHGTSDTAIDAGAFVIAAGERTDYELDFAAFEATAGYRVWTAPIRDHSATPDAAGVYPLSDSVRMDVDLYAGARFYDYSLRLETAADGAAESDEFWGEPLAGARLNVDLPHGFSFDVRGDVGGLGGHDMQSFSWNIEAAFQWQFHPNMALEVGYRRLGADSGSDDDEALFDASLAGLFGSFVIQF